MNAFLTITWRRNVFTLKFVVYLWAILTSCKFIGCYICSSFKVKSFCRSFLTEKLSHKDLMSNQLRDNVETKMTSKERSQAHLIIFLGACKISEKIQ
jgi:hypothetical protein